MHLYEINSFLIYRQRSPTTVETAFFKDLSERIIDPIIGRRRLLDNYMFVKSIPSAYFDKVMRSILGPYSELFPISTVLLIV